MAQLRFPQRPKRPQGGQPRAEEQPRLLHRDLCWYLVDNQALGLSGREIARRYGVDPTTVWPALRRIKALLPTIRELIPK